MQVPQDLRHALRQLRKSPIFTVTAVLTLALVIGANTAVFTLVQGILLRTLPVSNPSQLVRIGDGDDCCVNSGFAGTNGDFDIFSYNLFQYLRTAAGADFQSLSAVEAGEDQWPVREGNKVSASLHGETVSGNYFQTLGVRAYAGRMLEPSDDRAGASAVVVISYAAWENEFGADGSIVGKTIEIAAQPVTVVGVAPPGFFGDRVTATPPALYLPLAAQPVLAGVSDPAAALLNMPDLHWLYPIGRLRPGVNREALQAKLSAALRHWLYARPRYTSNGGAAIIPREHVVLVSAAGGIQTLQAETGAGLRLLMMLAGVVLLIGCANIANMMLARATERRGEAALRLALGETRGRMLRRTLSESVLLGCLGGVAGIAVAYAGARTILALAFPLAAGSAIAAAPSWPVLGFAFAVSVGTGVLFGLAPAWAASRAQPAEALRGASRATRDQSSGWQHALVIFQVALSLVLLAVALIAAHSLSNLENQNFGVATAARYVLHFDPAGAGYTPGRLPALYRRMQERFSSLPGVAHMGLGLYSPLDGDNWGDCVIPQGQPAPGPHNNCGASWLRVGPGYLPAIGVPIIEGRDFNGRDTATSPQVALVNQAFVKRYFPHQDAIGQHFGIDVPRYSSSFEIVGVFRDFKLNNPRQAIRPVFLRMINQRYGYKQASLQSGERESLTMGAMIVDFRHLPPSAPALLRHTMAGIDPNLVISDLRTFGSQVSGNFNTDRMLATLAGLFGALALLLASVGLYGVTAYLVARRRGEIGIRMALGASRGRIVGMVLRGMGTQAAIGLAIGIPAAVGTARLMASQMYRVGGYDGRALAGGAVALLLCALAAGLIPARRAAAVDPVRTLRAE